MLRAPLEAEHQRGPDSDVDLLVVMRVKGSKRPAAQEGQILYART